MVPDAERWRDPGRIPGAARYFLLRRWMRVFFRSLRCFFFAIRLRRFLMTEPTEPPSLDGTEDGHAVVRAKTATPSASPDEGGWA